MTDNTQAKQRIGELRAEIEKLNRRRTIDLNRITKGNTFVPIKGAGHG